MIDRIRIPSPVRVSPRLEGYRGLAANVPSVHLPARSFYLAIAAHAVASARRAFLTAEAPYPQTVLGAEIHSRALESAASWLAIAEANREKARALPGYPIPR
jgi:hypothetical protein